MTNLAAGLIGALVGLVGVVAGTWLNGRREHRRWVRDQQLKAAIAVIGSTGELYADMRFRGESPPEDRRKWSDAMRDARSAIYLLCDHHTVELAEELVQRIRRTARSTDATHDAETIALLGRLTQQLRRELGVPFDNRTAGTHPEPSGVDR